MINRVWVVAVVVSGCIGIAEGPDTPVPNDAQVVPTVDAFVGATPVADQPAPVMPEPADAGAVVDAGMPVVVDAGTPDAGTPDAGAGPRWPDQTVTGVPSGVTLAASNSLTITMNGTVVDARDVSGSITVRANDVVIRRCRVRHTDSAILLADGFRNLTIEDTRVEGLNTPHSSRGIRGNGGLTVRRVDVSGFAQGLHLEDGGGLVEDSYFHDMHDAQGKGSDTIEAWNAHHLVIRHNRLEMSGSDANSTVKLPMDVPGAGGDDVTIDDNLIAGGGWALYAGYDPSQPNSWSNVRVTNNRFSTRFFPKCGFWGAVAYAQSSLARGNVWHETGAPLNL